MPDSREHPIDLLRRAAIVLRDRALAANVRTGERWEYYTPADQAVGFEGHVAWDGDPQWSGIASTIVGTSAGPYIALLDPPVGSELADLLDWVALIWDHTAANYYPVRAELQNRAVRLAQLILREATP